MKQQKLNEMEKQILINAGWKFINDEYIYIPNDYDGCMAFGIINIRKILDSLSKLT